MDHKLEKYANAIVRVGINLQKGENVVITSDLACLDLVRKVNRLCWELGAKDVIVQLADHEMQLARFEAGHEEVFDVFPQFKADYRIAQMEERYHRIALLSPTLDLFSQVDEDRLRRSSMARSKALLPLQKYMDEGHVKWVVAAMASPQWARALFPELSVEDGMEKLWDHIFAACRITDDTDPVEQWQAHDRNLKAYENWLDEQELVSLHYEGPGTDFTLGLAEDAIWMGGSSKTPEGCDYMANIPTEEIFSCPDRRKINGRIQATKPLFISGKMIKDFWFEFKDGKVVDYDAREGREVLKTQLEMDEGARSLGEVAIVPNSSPISEMGFVFQSTLFDENAPCHLALGQAYSETLKGGETMSEEERKARGFNSSMIHVDFMVGGPELKITGTRKDGSEVLVLKDGEWAVKL